MNPPKLSVNAFLAGIIDYAGMYPPANLSLGEAFGNFVEYQSSVDAWMLSRFVIPAKRLVEIPKFQEDLSFTALTRGGKDVADFLENISLDISDIKSFCEAYSNASVEMCEAALPASSLTDKFTANEVVTRAADALNKNGITVFFEAPFGEGWESRVEKLTRALRKVKDKHVGLKLRTGGVTAGAFPSPGQIAWAIAEARDADVPMKYTAGLHHPIRHYNENVQAKMHGFLNVFGAGVLTFAIGISQKEMQAILEDENPANFIFDENGFEWKGLRANNLEISNARQFATSFGSCSFDEPREDLQKLNLL